VILSKSPLAVLLVTLHLELITQQHYTDSVKGDGSVDEFFGKLLKFHWMEESQHARIDQLEIDKLASQLARDGIKKAFADYADLLGAFDGLLKSQAEMDATTFERSQSKTLSATEKQDLITVQHKNYRKMFLVAGLTHRMFLDTVSKLDAEGAKQIAEKAASFA
jgi:hypothetical protein